MIILCFWESTSYIAEAINLSLACSVSLLYNQNSAFQDDGIVHLIRCCHCSPFIYNRCLRVFSARLQTTFALLIPGLWWTTPPVKLFHLPPLVITSSQPRWCHNSSPHIFQSGFGVSFTLNPALWFGPVKSALQSDKHTLICLCWINTVIRQALTSPWPFTFCFFSCDKAMWAIGVPPAWCPWKIWQCKDVIAGMRLRCFDGQHMWDTKTAATLDSPSGMSTRRHWRSHSEVGLEFQTRLCLSVLPACENRLKSYWPVQPGMCWTLSLEGGKSDSSSHLTKKKKNPQQSLTV